MGPVEPLRLILAGQAQEHQHMISGPSKIDSLLQQLFVIIGRANTEPGSDPDVRASRKFRLQLLKRNVNAGWIDLGAPSTLEPRRTRKLTDHSDRAALFRLQRQ